MTVLGVKAPKIQQVVRPSVKVFVEVRNFTKRSINLRRMEYRLVAERWFDAQGKVSVTRTIPAGASAVLEILVPISKNAPKGRMRGVPYSLDARLVAIADKTERSWKLRAKGALSSAGRAGIPRVRVADLH